MEDPACSERIPEILHEQSSENLPWATLHTCHSGWCWFLMVLSHSCTGTREEINKCLLWNIYVFSKNRTLSYVIFEFANIFENMHFNFQWCFYLRIFIYINLKQRFSRVPELPILSIFSFPEYLKYLFLRDFYNSKTLYVIDLLAIYTAF